MPKLTSKFQSLNQGLVDTTTKGHFGSGWFNDQNFYKVVDIGALSQRFYGMNIDDKVGFNDQFFNGTGNSHHGFCDFQGSGVNFRDSMGGFCTKKNPSSLSRDLFYQKEQINYEYLCNMNRPCSNNEGLQYDDVVARSFFSSLHGSQLMGLNSECDCSIAKQRAKSVNNPFSALPNSRIQDTYSYEDHNFILQGECLKYGSEQRAKDQMGCRYLQRIFDEGTSEDVQIIFNGIIHHILELMKDPFGNYLVQKLLTACSDEQRTQLVLMVTKDLGELVKTSRTTHG
ncbi:putative pumilio homolog 10 [Lycium ferocissimum]|uniref:putative pumilio homolog 10 n=1 Tax=Lycium ferocissimum TaxID=112874 RepID=UPI002814CE62|nr:putative pumilio homolog 10 [Lycium ferocissimum]